MFIHSNTFMRDCVGVYHTYGAHTTQAVTESHTACLFNYTGSSPAVFFLLFMMCRPNPPAKEPNGGGGVFMDFCFKYSQ